MSTPNREWLDLHGFEWVHCSCGFVGYSDSGCLDCEPVIEDEPGGCLETMACRCPACAEEAS